MIWDCQQKARIIVVDAGQGDYAALRQAAEAHRTEVVFFASGQEALREAGSKGPAAWVVNMSLPDMSGTDFRSLLRSRGNRAPMALVGEEYRVEDEIAARAAGAEMYFAKSMAHAILAATV